MSRLSFLCLPLLLVPLTACAGLFGTSLSADPIDSRVMDAETGEPIEGAIVLARWALYEGSLTGHASACGVAAIEETITDKDGKFHIPGWGPISAICGEMRNGNPMVYVFKPGYGFGMFPNEQPGISLVDNVNVTHTDWNYEHPMMLKKFSDMNLKVMGINTYSNNFNILNGSLEEFTTQTPDSCNWKKMPLMLRALELERLQISQAKGHPFGGVTAELIYRDAWFQKAVPQCGSTKAFVEGLMK